MTWILVVISYFCICSLSASVQSPYPLALNWKMCVLPRWDRLTTGTQQETYAYLFHNVTHAKVSFYVMNPVDLNPSPTVLHQKWFTDEEMQIVRNTLGAPDGYFNLQIQSIKVTANGSVDASRILMSLKGIESTDTSKMVDMTLYHTGDGTSLDLQWYSHPYCTGPSCGQNGLYSTYPPAVIVQELYFEDWSSTDSVVPITKVEMARTITSCNRVDTAVEASVTHYDYSTRTRMKEVVDISPSNLLNDSSKGTALTVTYNDIISFDLELSVTASSQFAVCFALPQTESCAYFEVIAELSCSSACAYSQCRLESGELDSVTTTVMCRYKCRPTTSVIIRHLPIPGQAYLPESVSVLEVAAIALY